MSSNNTQVLEFGLESERYCLAIEYVAEIVGRDEITSIPNTPTHVLGAMDLRGDSLRVLDPKAPFGVDGDPTGERVVVLDDGLGDDDIHLAWIVDSVHDVFDADADELDDSVESQGVYGSFRKDGRLILWVDPETVIE